MKSIKLLLVLLLAGQGAVAQTTPDQLKNMANAEGPRLVEIFKDFHQNPELAFEEVRTADVVAKELKALGYTTNTGIGKTGVVGILKNGDGPVVMWRADMDCNSVKETTGLAYASTKTAKNADGVVVPLGHMCGHDAHTTWLLGVAKMMVNLKKEWKGTLVLVAQPAEETGFGAIAMADEMYTKGVPVPNYLLGMHTGPVAVGLYLNMAGDRMAGADQIDVTFHGIGGHGSTPEQTKDPIIMAANAILQYQTLVSRNMDPQRPAVLTVGAISAGTDNNVIPASATLKLNLRWYSQKDRSTLVDGIKRINEGIAIANGLPKELYPTFTQKQSLGPLNNDKNLVEKMNIPLEKMFGVGKNLSLPPVMGSEDFQVLVRDYPNVPYDYLLIGVAPPDMFAKAQKEGKYFPFSNHNGNFMVDLSAIPFGTAVATAMVLEAFRK